MKGAGWGKGRYRKSNAKSFISTAQKKKHQTMLKHNLTANFGPRKIT